MTPEGGYASWIYAGLEWMADLDGNLQTRDAPKVINVPLSKADFARDVACAKAVDNLCRLEIFCVITVGLDVHIPPELRDVPIPVNPFAVGTLDNRDGVILFGENRSVAFDPRIVPDLSAPATNLRIASIDGTVRDGRGEMLACAQAMGAVALLLEADPDLTVADLRWILKQTAFDLGVPGLDSTYGAGKLDSYAAVRYAQAEPDQPDIAEPDLMDTGLEITPRQITIELMARQTDTQTVMISNQGRHTKSLHIRIEKPKLWLDFQPTSLTIHPGGVGTLTISYDTRTLSAGDYTAEILVESALEETTLSVELSVRPSVAARRELDGLGARNTESKAAVPDDAFTAFGNTEAPDGDNDNDSDDDSDDSLDDHADSREDGTRIRYGGEQSGEVGRRGDRDYFLFEGKQGDVITVDITAQVIGSPLDSYLYLYGPDGRQLARNDDDGTLDSLIADYELPADGQYAIRVNAWWNRGGPGQFYILELLK